MVKLACFLTGVNILVILDLHSHSIKSDDGRAKVQNYCQWIKTRKIPIDGFVLTEHRQFDNESDYSDLAEKHGLKGFDALHLSSAVWLHQELSSPVTFLCADQKLQKASELEKLHQPD